MFKPAAVIYTKSGNTYIRALSTVFSEDKGHVRTVWLFSLAQKALCDDV